MIAETGKGKSTIAWLLLGYDVPQKGQILFNRREYTSFSLESIRSHLGLVPQEPTLMCGSLLDNVSFFRTSADLNWVGNLINWCCLTETVERFPNGLNTNVFEAGTGISGGEKQRIAIARALFSRPDFLILDEAMSAMDPETETKLMDNLMDLPWKPAVLLFTHRYAHLSKCDKVINLNIDRIPPGEEVPLSSGEPGISSNYP